MSRRGLITTGAVAVTGLLSAGAAAAAGAFDPLSLFDRWSPKDGGAHEVAHDLAYGPDPRQRFDLYAPRKASGPLPMLTFFYGGGWNSGSKAVYRWVGRAFAARGFLVGVPDYRVVPQVHFPAFVEDGAAAIAKILEVGSRYGGDPARHGVAGHSAGAHIAILLALDTHYLKAASAPPAAIKAGVGIAGPYDFYPFDVPASVNAFGQYPDPHATQPLTFARADAPPLLLQHGDIDKTVRLHNSVALRDAIVARGGQAELKVYKGLSHEKIVLALSPVFRGSAPVLRDASEFLHAHLG